MGSRYDISIDLKNKKPPRKPATKSKRLAAKPSSFFDDDTIEPVKPKKVRGPNKKKSKPSKKKTVQKSESTREKPKKKTRAKEPESSFDLTKSDIESGQSETSKSSKISEPVSKAKRPRKRTIEETSRNAPSPLPLPKVPKKKPSPTITKKGTALGIHFLKTVS